MAPPDFHWPWRPRYSSKIGGMQAVGELGHTLSHVPGAGDTDPKGGSVALGYPAVLQNGIHRWTIQVHKKIWMIGFATDVWLDEQPGCQAQPGCWLLGADGSKNDIGGSRNFGEGFGKNTEVTLELWLDDTTATMKVAPEGWLLKTMFSVNFASAPHRGTQIFPVVFALRGVGDLATVKLYHGPQPFPMAGIEHRLVTCHQAVANGDLIYVHCTSTATGATLAVVPCEITGVVADLHNSLAEHLDKPRHELILQSQNGCFFTGAEHLSELKLDIAPASQRESYGKISLMDAELEQIISEAVLSFTEVTTNPCEEDVEPITFYVKPPNSKAVLGGCSYMHSKLHL